MTKITRRHAIASGAAVVALGTLPASASVAPHADLWRQFRAAHDDMKRLNKAWWEIHAALPEWVRKPEPIVVISRGRQELFDGTGRSVLFRPRRGCGFGPGTTWNAT